MQSGKSSPVASGSTRCSSWKLLPKHQNTESPKRRQHGTSDLDVHDVCPCFSFDSARLANPLSQIWRSNRSSAASHLLKKLFRYKPIQNRLCPCGEPIIERSHDFYSGKPFLQRRTKVPRMWWPAINKVRFKRSDIGVLRSCLSGLRQDILHIPGGSHARRFPSPVADKLTHVGNEGSAFLDSGCDFRGLCHGTCIVASHGGRASLSHHILTAFRCDCAHQRPKPLQPKRKAPPQRPEGQGGKASLFSVQPHMRIQQSMEGFCSLR